MALTFQIRSALLPTHAKVVAFRGSEGISRPYVFDVYVNVQGGDEIDLEDGPGARVALTIDGDGITPVTIGGIIAHVELLRAIHTPHNALYKVRLVPNLWQLSLTKHSRVFTKMSVPDVIAAVLQEEGVDNFELRLHHAYEPEEHITQYKESSLDFIQRWMEREGLYYFFEQEDGTEKLVITDDRATHTFSRSVPVPYQPGGEHDASSGPAFYHFAARHASLPAAVRFTDYDYQKPQLDVGGTSPVSKIGVGEVVTYGQRFFTPDKGASLARIRAEDLRARAKQFSASGPVTGLSAGYQFSIENHPKLQLNTAYLAVTVEHFGWAENAADAWGKLVPHEYDDVYRVDVSAIDASQQYRHPETVAWPRIDGYENAVVDGPATSDYAQIDAHGRYAIKFKFDEGSLKNGRASTFVRKMQPHAGTVEGWHFPERKGTEVICAFMGGDPDRPVIVGAVPTAVTPSPVTATNHTQNVIQTGGSNRLEIEDLAGQQRITLSTPHATTHLLMGNPMAGHELIAKTQGNALYHTDVDTDHRIGANWTVKVGADHIEEIAAAVLHKIGATLNQMVEGAVTQEFNNTHTLKVVGDVVNTYMANHTQDIVGDVTKKIGGTQTKTITGDDIMSLIGDKVHEIAGSEARTISGEAVEKYKSSQEITVAGSFSQTVGGLTNFNFEGAKNECVAGVSIGKFVGAKFETNLGAFIEITAGAKTEVTAAVSIECTPYKLELELSREGLHVKKDEVAALKNELKAMNEELAGLKSSEAGLKDVAAGLHEVASGLHGVECGLHNVAAALCMLE